MTSFTYPDTRSAKGRTSWLSELDEGGTLQERWTLVNADNATLFLQNRDGRRHECVDFMSAYAAVNFGHRNPDLRGAFDATPDLAGPFPGPAAEEVAWWLCTQLGDPAKRRVLFQIGGSFAVATATALARRARPGRIAVIQGSFHGLGVDTGAFSSVQREFSLQDTGFTKLIDDEVVRLDYGENPPSWDGISCLLYETIQGANGYVPLEPAWLKKLTAAAAASGVVTIADEIQCGFFRHGALSPATALGLDPDIALYSKSLTNGIYPLSAVVYKESLGRHDGVFLAHTFQTSTLGTAAALEVIRYIETHDVAALAKRTADAISGLARKLAEEGYAKDVFLTGPTLSFEPTLMSSAELVQKAFDRGVLIFRGGARGERIRIAPPLTAPVSQISEGAEEIWSAITAGCDIERSGHGA
jgi:4-aminobutyrate aminotransferase-like enzyme